jgi:mannose/cellobiose epimerase-like protein (N-acyl-D-glucosamine 2-epimerase family)
MFKKLLLFSSFSLCCLFASQSVNATQFIDSNLEVQATKNAVKNIEFNPGIINNLPAGQRWIRHVNQEIMPFWTMQPALGNPVGNFPTFRCNNGSLWNPSSPCPEILNASSWVKNDLNKEYVVAKSRQIYVYGVAYHLTGNERMLQLARNGVDYIRKNAFQSNGSVVTYWENGVPGPVQAQRNTQHLAYAGLGLSFYYYLTRDEAVLQDIIKLKNHIFNNYYDPNLEMLRWSQTSNIKNLTAQLDQLNTYMVLTIPLLPEPLQSQWKADALRIVQIMNDKFYSPQHNLFWREGNVGESFQQVDLGHTCKAFWFIYLVGKLTNNTGLMSFAEIQAPKILEKAYVNNTGSWATLLNSNGSVNTNGNKISWMYNEMNQMTATFSLRNPALAQYLVKTYGYWLNNIVDYQYYETYPEVTAAGVRVQRPKIDAWNHGYHATEQALVAYITTQALQNKPVVLHYAYKGQPSTATIRPYFYSGRIQSRQISNLNSFPNHKKHKITFANIQ